MFTFLLPFASKMGCNNVSGKVKPTFSRGYSVFLQTAHLSWVPQNMEESLLGRLAYKDIKLNMLLLVKKQTEMINL